MYYSRENGTHKEKKIQHSIFIQVCIYSTWAICTTYNSNYKHNGFKISSIFFNLATFFSVLSNKVHKETDIPFDSMHFCFLTSQCIFNCVFLIACTFLWILYSFRSRLSFKFSAFFSKLHFLSERFLKTSLQEISSVDHCKPIPKKCQSWVFFQSRRNVRLEADIKVILVLKQVRQLFYPAHIAKVSILGPFCEQHEVQSWKAKSKVIS